MIDYPLQLVIEGHPYVKKNNQKVRFDYRTGKSFKYDTKAYSGWHHKALDQLEALGYDIEHKATNKKLHALNQELMPALINEPINLKCQFFISRDSRVDLSALYEGIQDVLVEVGILEDDNRKIVASHDGSGVAVDSLHPRMEITITRKEPVQKEN